MYPLNYQPMKTSLLAEHIRSKDFPKEGISFKDITPILSNPELNKVIFVYRILTDKEIDAIVGVESRVFIGIR